jgi:sugar phosphate isomerase/epimerase
MKKKAFSRRDFVKTMALGSAALGIGCVSKPEKYIAPISVQLYSVRHVIFDDFPGAIKKIADMGYVGVETWGGLSENMDLNSAAKTIKDAGLQVMGCHCDLPVADKRDIALQMADAYQSERLIFWGGSKENLFSNPDQIKNTIETYNKISEDLKSRGITYGVHNHTWEFEATDSGVTPFYYYLENLSNDIIFEIDTYWATLAGCDVAKALKDCGSRAPLLHIKDGTTKKGPKEGIHVPAGMGAMNFPAIVQAGAENIKWMTVEFDEYDGDIFTGLQQSYSYLTKNQLAKGNI